MSKKNREVRKKKKEERKEEEELDSTVNIHTEKNRKVHFISPSLITFQCQTCYKEKYLFRDKMFSLKVDPTKFLNKNQTKTHMSQIHPDFAWCYKDCNMFFKSMEELEWHDFMVCPMDRRPPDQRIKEYDAAMKEKMKKKKKKKEDEEEATWKEDVAKEKKKDEEDELDN
jgi:hypothetical protein